MNVNSMRSVTVYKIFDTFTGKFSRGGYHNDMYTPRTLRYWWSRTAGKTWSRLCDLKAHLALNEVADLPSRFQVVTATFVVARAKRVSERQDDDVSAEDFAPRYEQPV